MYLARADVIKIEEVERGDDTRDSISIRKDISVLG